MSTRFLSTPPHILLAEDDAALRELLCDILTREGYIVTEASSGEAALEQSGQAAFDAVILDLVFRRSPVQGLEVLQQLRRRNPDLPVIVMSGRASDEAVLQTIRQGGFSFLIKPIHDVYNVLFMVAEAVEQKRFGPHFAARLEHGGAQGVIKGLPVDAHIYLRQYLSCFENYLQQVKGVSVQVGFETRFDNANITLEADADQQWLFAMLDDFLHFPERILPRHFTFQTSLSREDQAGFMLYLEQQIEQFSQNVSRALRRQYIDPMYPNVESAHIFHLNPQKIINKRHLTKGNAAPQAPELEIAVYDLSVQIRLLVENHQTLLAITTLQDFCEGHHLTAFSHRITRLQQDFNRAINEQLTGVIDFKSFAQQLDQIHRTLLDEVLAGVERLAARA